jgi:hypothetical protein
MDPPPWSSATIYRSENHFNQRLKERKLQPWHIKKGKDRRETDEIQDQNIAEPNVPVGNMFPQEASLFVKSAPRFTLETTWVSVETIHCLQLLMAL